MALIFAVVLMKILKRVDLIKSDKFNSSPDYTWNSHKIVFSLR